MEHYQGGDCADARRWKVKMKTQIRREQAVVNRLNQVSHVENYIPSFRRSD